MRATIVLASCFLFSASVFAAEPQRAAKMKPVVVAQATMPTTHKAAAREVTRGAAIESSIAEGSLEKFGATGLPQ